MAIQPPSDENSAMRSSPKGTTNTPHKSRQLVCRAPEPQSGVGSEGTGEGGGKEGERHKVSRWSGMRLDPQQQAGGGRRQSRWASSRQAAEG